MIVPLGKSRQGEIWSDVRLWPHLLVAGWTGSGKSNYLHCLLTFLAYMQNVKLFIIDLKRMEFECYSEHAEVAYTTEKALRILNLSPGRIRPPYGAISKGKGKQHQTVQRQARLLCPGSR